MPDGLEVFRQMLGGSSNRVEKMRPKSDFANTVSTGMGGGGGQDTNPPFGGGGGGMDPWQTSVEKRLDSLDRRVTSIEEGVSEIKTNLATLTTNVSHLPGKGFIVATTVTALTVLTLLIALVTNIDKLTGGSSASDAHRIEAVQNNN